MRHHINAADLRERIESYEEDLDAAAEAETTSDPDNLDKLHLAQAALQFAIGLLEEVADDTHDEHARAYLVDQLKVHAGSDHGFLTRDFNLDEWIERIETGDTDETE